MVRDPALHRFDWFPRAMVSGFIATLVMAILFFVAYGLAHLLGGVELNPRPGAQTFAGWMHALSENRVLDLAGASIYAAATLHLIIGMVFALLYAFFFEPRLPGTGAVKGMWFSLIPWAASVLVFFPLVGAGILGSNLGAGPLPALGNLLLHLAYGATLGLMYGPLGDIPADEMSRTAPVDAPDMIEHYETASARGMLVGGIAGAILGVVGTIVSAGPGGTILGVPSLIFIPLTAAVGLIIGGLWGSFVGLAPEYLGSPQRHAYHGR
jgi:hypothetical protein